MHRVQLEARIGQPLGKLHPRQLVVIVEVRACREQLDRLESVRGDVDQVIASEPVFVEQVCGNAEVGHVSYCRNSSRCAASSSRRRPKRG